MHRTKRHVTTGPYPMDRRNQQYDQSSNNNNQDNHQNRPRKRPCRFLIILFEYKNSTKRILYFHLKSKKIIFKIR